MVVAHFRVCLFTIHPFLPQVSSLWVPTVSLVNADFPSVHRTDAMLSVEKSSPPLKDNVEQPARGEARGHVANFIHVEATCLLLFY